MGRKETNGLAKVLSNMGLDIDLDSMPLGEERASRIIQALIDSRRNCFYVRGDKQKVTDLFAEFGTSKVYCFRAKTLTGATQHNEELEKQYADYAFVDITAIGRGRLPIP